MSGRFLERWSRLKRQGAIGTPPAAPEMDAAGAAAAVPAPAAELPPTGLAAEAGAQTLEASADTLPPIASLTLESDFSAFLKREVADAVRKQALKKLFAEPHFNVMDGLDIYIDDYSVAAPIPPDVLARLKHARELLADDEAPAEAGGQVATADGAGDAPPTSAGGAVDVEAAPIAAAGGDEAAQAPDEGNLSADGQNVPPQKD